MKSKFKKFYMGVAYNASLLSYCERRQVGAVIVKNDSIIAHGYNGTLSGEENVCEDENGLTKPTVVHAEDNALRKLTRSSESGVDAIMFVTTAPCEICAGRIADAKIKKVYYHDIYRNDNGLKVLQKRGVEVEKL